MEYGLKPGSLVGGRYAIRGILGKGGMGVVYSADDSELPGVRVAIKQMVCRVDDPKDRQAAIRQFQHEADILRALEHDNIPRVYDCFEEAGQYFLVMELVAGHTLTAYADLSGQRPPAFLPTLGQVLDWGMQIARVLVYLHNQQPNPVVYKDLKPENLMLTRSGVIMLLDFGLAKALTPQGRYTTILKGVGSPGFAAPEQYARQQSDARADLYGLGATMYALLSGQIPIDSADRQQAVLDGHPDPLEPLLDLAPDTPRALDAIVRRLMAVRKADRYQRAEDVVRALEALRDGRDEGGLPGVVSKVLASLWGGGRGVRGEEVRQFIVSPQERDAFRSVSAALVAAREGDVIRVLPGYYRDTLVVGQSVEIIGDGDAESIVIEGTDNSTVIMLGTHARIQGLTLRCTQAGAPTVDVRHGTLTLENCHVSAASVACVQVSGGASYAIIRGCLIHDGAEAGLLVDNQAGATVEDTEIVRHHFAAIEIGERADVEVRRCIIRDAGGAGVYAHHEARGTIDECDISQCAAAGVTLTDGADPLLRRCRIHDGDGRGLVIGSGSLGVFEHCEIFAHQEEGVFMYDGANAELRHCKVSKCGNAGAVIHNGSYGLLEDTEVSANAEAGVLIAEGADPILRSCRITQNQVGVRALPLARGTIEFCDLGGNRDGPIEVHVRSEVKQRDNRF